SAGTGEHESSAGGWNRASRQGRAILALNAELYGQRHRGSRGSGKTKRTGVQADNGERATADNRVDRASARRKNAAPAHGAGEESADFVKASACAIGYRTSPVGFRCVRLNQRHCPALVGVLGIFQDLVAGNRKSARLRLDTCSATQVDRESHDVADDG